MAIVAEVQETEQQKQDEKATDSRPPRGKGTLPPLPGGNTYTIPFDDAVEYTAKLTERDWAHVEGYVFRLRPRILRLPPLDKNIGYISAPITKKWMLDNFGSGKYQLKLNDTDKANKRGIFECFVEFDDADFPPKYDIRELDVTHRENRQLVEHLKRTGKLTVDGEVITPTQPVAATDAMATALKDIAIKAMEGGRGAGEKSLDSQAFSKMMDMMSNASSKSIEIAMGQLKGTGGGNDTLLTLVMTFMMKQLEVMEKRAAAPTDNGVQTILIQMLTDSQKRAEQAEERYRQERKEAEAERQRMHEKEMKALENRGDPFAMVDKVFQLKERFGAAEPDSRDWKEKLVDDGLQYVPDLIELGKAALGKVYSRGPAANPNGAAPNANQARPPQPQPHTVDVRSIEVASAAEPQPQPTGEQPVNTSQQQAQPGLQVDPDVEYLISVFQKWGGRLVDAFRDDPNSGEDVAAAVSSKLMAGKAGYERIARMGRDKILLAIASIPQMQADILQVGTAEMLSDFIDGFIAYGEPDDEDEDDEEQPEVPAPARPARPEPVARRKKAAAGVQ